MTTHRNYRILGLTPSGTLLVDSTPFGVHDSGETLTEWGAWGLTDEELKAVARDRRKRK